MALGDSALLEVQWIEMAYNLSDSTPIANASGSLCNLDDTDAAGEWEPFVFPEPHDTATSGGYILGVNTFFIVAAIILTLT